MNQLLMTLIFLTANAKKNFKDTKEDTFKKNKLVQNL